MSEGPHGVPGIPPHPSSPTTASPRARPPRRSSPRTKRSGASARARRSFPTWISRSSITAASARARRSFPRRIPRSTRSVASARGRTTSPLRVTSRDARCTSRARGRAPAPGLALGRDRTTFQARPSFSRARMTSGRGVDLPAGAGRARPSAGRRGGCGARPRRSDGSASQNTLVDWSSVVEAPAPEEVADRVDRPGDVVQQEHAHEAAPQQAGERAGVGAGDQRSRAPRAARGRAGPSRRRACRSKRMPAVLDEVARVLRCARRARARSRASRRGRASSPRTRP